MNSLKSLWSKYKKNHTKEIGTIMYFYCLHDVDATQGSIYNKLNAFFIKI